MKIDQLFRCETCDIPNDIMTNLFRLLGCMNSLEALAKKPFEVTSGFRTWAQHKEVYRQINDRRLLAGKQEIPIPLHSQHLQGNACDIHDPDGRWKVWVAENLVAVEQAGLYMEAFRFTDTWVHFQRVPPRSGNRFFIP